LRVEGTTTELVCEGSDGGVRERVSSDVQCEATHRILAPEVDLD
jgi:hypothetical protein